MSVIAFIIFQTLPRQIIGLFGSGSSAYYEFAENFFRIFLFMTFLNGIQPLTSTFCTAVGEPNKGTFLSLTRQIIFFLPIVLIFPIIAQTLGHDGINGIMYAAPVSDSMAAAVAIIMAGVVFKKFDILEKE